MKSKNFLTLILAFTFAMTATFAFADPAKAACSYNGYTNSDGTCATSLNYNYQLQNQSQLRFNDQAIQLLIVRLQALIRLLEARLDGISPDTTLSVSTRAATSIGDDQATLQGLLYLNNEDEAEVYFEYGTSRADLNEETQHESFDDDNSTYLFSRDVDGLDDNTTYYFRAAGEDEEGDKDFGSILSFRTDSTDSSDLDLPDLETRTEDNVTEDEAELNGYVDMNDYDSGEVFFVYGEDESAVEDVEDDNDTYNEIDEQGDDLQKVKVDNDLDGTATYQETVTGLDADTQIYYSICVEFEDDNNERLMCGDTESFMTESN